MLSLVFKTDHTLSAGTHGQYEAVEIAVRGSRPRDPSWPHLRPGTHHGLQAYFTLFSFTFWRKVGEYRHERECENGSQTLLSIELRSTVFHFVKYIIRR
jgi:hypothetical protein